VQRAGLPGGLRLAPMADLARLLRDLRGRLAAPNPGARARSGECGDSLLSGVCMGAAPLRGAALSHRLRVDPVVYME